MFAVAKQTAENVCVSDAAAPPHYCVHAASPSCTWSTPPRPTTTSPPSSSLTRSTLSWCWSGTPRSRSRGKCRWAVDLRGTTNISNVGTLQCPPPSVGRDGAGGWEINELPHSVLSSRVQVHGQLCNVGAFLLTCIRRTSHPHLVLLCFDCTYRRLSWMLGPLRPGSSSPSRPAPTPSCALSRVRDQSRGPIAPLRCGPTILGLI